MSDLSAYAITITVKAVEYEKWLVEQVGGRYYCAFDNPHDAFQQAIDELKSQQFQVDRIQKNAKKPHGTLVHRTDS